MPLRRLGQLAACALVLYLGWTALARSAHEVVTLHAPGSGTQDYYTRVWAVDEEGFVWIRAETPDRTWLRPLAEDPRVTLWRADVRRPMRARVWDDPETRLHVDALFREKYGMADLVRAVALDRRTIPVRLEPR